jgi:hypothetical protein
MALPPMARFAPPVACSLPTGCVNHTMAFFAERRFRSFTATFEFATPVAGRMPGSLVAHQAHRRGRRQLAPGTASAPPGSYSAGRTRHRTLCSTSRR